MKLKFSLLIFTFLLFNCGEKKESKIEYVSNDEIVEEFDRTKFPILQDAVVLKENNSLIAAIEKFDQAEKEYGPMIPIFLNRGVVYHQIGKSKESISDFSKCLIIDSNYYAALTNRGIAYVHANQTDKAILDLNKAIQIKPNESSTYLNRAIAFNNLDKSKLACADLKKAKELGLMEKYGSGGIPMSLKFKCLF